MYVLFCIVFLHCIVIQLFQEQSLNIVFFLNCLLSLRFIQYFLYISSLVCILHYFNNFFSEFYGPSMEV